MNTDIHHESNDPITISTLSPATRLTLGILIFVGLAVAVIGIVTFVAPVTIVGLAIALVAFLFLVLHRHSAQ